MVNGERPQVGRDQSGMPAGHAPGGLSWEECKSGVRKRPGLERQSAYGLFSSLEKGRDWTVSEVLRTQPRSQRTESQVTENGQTRDRISLVIVTANKGEPSFHPGIMG